MRLDPITLIVLTDGVKVVMPSWRIQKTYLQTRYAITNKSWFALWIRWIVPWTVRPPVMPDDHSKLVPLLPIPNRTVKRLSADDSADSRVKVGHRQALIVQKPNWFIQLGFLYQRQLWFFCLYFTKSSANKKLKYSLTGVKNPVYNLRLSWLQQTIKTKRLRLLSGSQDH